MNNKSNKLDIMNQYKNWKNLYNYKKICKTKQIQVQVQWNKKYNFKIILLVDKQC